MALLRDGLFKSSSTIPRTITRHASARKRLSQTEKLARTASSSSLPNLPAIEKKPDTNVVPSSERKQVYSGRPGYITTGASRSVKSPCKSSPAS